MSSLTRREILKAAAAAAVGLMVPSTLSAALTPTVKNPSAAGIPPWLGSSLNYKAVVESLNPLVEGLSASKVFPMLDSGSRVMQTARIDEGDPLYFDTQQAMYKALAVLTKGRFSVKTIEYGVSTLHVHLDDVLALYGAKLDPAATASFRVPWTARQDFNFANPSEEQLLNMARRWNPDGADQIARTLVKLRVDLERERPEYDGPVSNCDTANDAWEQGSEWPVPLFVTECGHRFWYADGKWVVDVPVKGDPQAMFVNDPTAIYGYRHDQIEL